MIIKYEKTDNLVKEEGPSNLFTVLFRDKSGNRYSWMPKWSDLQLIYLRACMTEYYNNEEAIDRANLRGFEEVARRIVDQAY